jgi:hypothetical protein
MGQNNLDDDSDIYPWTIPSQADNTYLQDATALTSVIQGNNSGIDDFYRKLFPGETLDFTPWFKFE